MNKGKPFDISKQMVWDAYKRVRQNQGTCGVDAVSIEEFERDLNNNLYKLWNRMSSGSYFPPAVRLVEIPKKDGSMRSLGIPTVSDRIAQEVVKRLLEPSLEPLFHEDSYGYRPGKSAIQAVGVARTRCWRYNWVLDVDIKGFFDNLDHELLLKALRKHTDAKWILIYVTRWLKAPAVDKNGIRIERFKGTPQGGVISPLLANLFLHYAFDAWMKRTHPGIVFERYADDIVVHCVTEKQTIYLKLDIAQRLRMCKLALHPAKTKIVYCKDDERQLDYPATKFDFLGFTFSVRCVRSQMGKFRARFTPAISNESTNKIRQVMRGWQLPKRVNVTLEDLAKMINPSLRGWMNYYGKYYKTKSGPVYKHLNEILMRWIKHKYGMASKESRARHMLGEIAVRNPGLFVHWQFGIQPTVYRR